MKTRIITASIGIPALVCVLLLAPVWVIGLLLGIISVGAAYELLRCALPQAPKYIYGSHDVFFTLSPGQLLPRL